MKRVGLAAVLGSSALPCFAIGGFAVTNVPVPYWPDWSTESNVTTLAGDYDGDGLSDLALTGVSGWGTVPVAFSNGNGTFNVTNQSVASFPFWSSESKVKHLVGDYNHDGKADDPPLGPAGWRNGNPARLGTPRPG